MRTSSELTEELIKLSHIAQSGLPDSKFGDDNMAAIAGQMSLIYASSWSGICQRSRTNESDHVWSEMQFCCDWIEGRTDLSPSESWSPLVK